MRRFQFPLLVAAAAFLMLLLKVVGVTLELWGLWVLVVVGIVLVHVSRGPRWRGAIAFVLPVLVSVPWVVDKGDEDGLWILWFPFVLYMVPLIAMGSWLGSRISLRLREK